MKISNKLFGLVAMFVFALAFNFSVFAGVGKTDTAPKTHQTATVSAVVNPASPVVTVFYYAALNCAGNATIAFEPKIIKKRGVRVRIYQPPESNGFQMSKKSDFHYI